MSRGSQFNIGGTVVGVLFLQVVVTGLTFMGYQEDVQNIAQGVILVGAILISRLGRRVGERGTGHGRAPFVALRAVTKQYPGVLAVDEVTLDLGDQQGVGLVGKNGAGKSTLIKVLAGAVRPDAGHVAIDGHEVVFHEPHQSTHAGLAFVHQDLQDVPQLTVAENVMLGLGYRATPACSSTGRR